MTEFAVSSVINELPHGGRRMTYGSFTNGGTDVGGEISTGLYIVESFSITPYSASAVLTNCCTVNETFPLNGSGEQSVTIKCDSGVSGYWRAIGW
jgi:hypothetical protein